MGIGEAELQLEDERQMITEDRHTFQERLQTEQVGEQWGWDQLKAEAKALVAEENGLLNELGSSVVTQNLSELAEREGEEGERSTEQKYQYTDILSTSDTKRRETEAVFYRK